MAAAQFLAIDLGASSGRVVAATLTPNQIKTHEIHRFSNQPVQILDHLHWNVFSLYEHIKVALAKCARDVTSELQGIGIDTWGVDFGFVARDNTVISLPYAYRDGRTNGMPEEAFKRMPREKIYEKTGIQFMPFNSIFQLLAYVIEESSVLEVADKLLFMPDLLNFLFSGEKVSEFSIASTSQLYDPIHKTWANEIFTALNLPPGIMCPIIPTGTELGPLLPAITKETGLSQASIIATASHDTAAAVAAVPATGTDWAYLSSGTWSLMGIELENPIINAQSMQYNFTNEGGVEGSIRFLKNIAGLWLVQECRRIWQREGDSYDYDQLTQLAAESSEPTGLIDPDDSRFLLPENMPEAIFSYLRETSQSLPQTKGGIIRTILESLALKYRYTLEQINQLRGTPIQVLHIVGGGTKNELLNQFAANACGIPVIAGPTEATAIGNIAVQAVTKGIFASIAEARSVIRNSFTLKEYQPQQPAQWEERFDRFREMVEVK